jgi:glyoxylase-like metal-dependent hydrolase (beta-lactamase superfamily II)
METVELPTTETPRAGCAIWRLAIILLVAFASNASAESWCDAPPAPELAALKPAGVQDEWFKVYAVAPGVFAITEPRQYEGVNSFLIVGSERAVLFDSGMAIARISDLVRKITALPVTVLNSHTHFDHVGGNHEFDDVRNLDIPFSKASARGEISDELREYASHSLDKDRVCGALPAGATNSDYAIPTWGITSNIRDGERLDLGSRVLEVMQTPGHTPDSLCLLDAANGLLFTGDTFYSGEVYLWAPETDITGYAASIAKLVNLAPGLKLLLPAHGPPVAEPGQLLELKKALQDIEAGGLPFEKTSTGRRLFKFEHFSILMNGSASKN